MANQPLQNQTILFEKVFAYGDQQVNDHGYGCVYRCVQTLRHYYQLKISHLFSYIQAVYALDDAIIQHYSDLGEKQKLWIEPPSVRKLIPEKNVQVWLFCPPSLRTDTFLSRIPQLSHRSDFDLEVRDQVTCQSLINASLTNKHPLIIDDKICSYVLCGESQKKTLLGGRSACRNWSLFLHFIYSLLCKTMDAGNLL